MELNALTRSVGDIFSLNKRYLVPRFQREYSWAKEEIDEFWVDILQQIKLSRSGEVVNEEYFIGCIVLVGEDSKPDYLIVDGQQRLTTLTILLRAIVARLLDLNDHAAASALYENVIEGTDNDGKKYFKLVNESPKPYFQNELQSIRPEGLKKAETKEEKLLFNAYNTFTKNLKSFNLPGLNELDSIKALRLQVLNYLKFILVTAKREDDAYTIFETLNARGMSLSSVDLIKNWIFKNFTQTHPNDNAKEIWNEIRKMISEFSNLETFFRHYWNSRYSFASDDRLYKSFNDARKVGKISPARDFLIELKDAAILYRMIGMPLDKDWPVKKEKTLGRSFELLNQYKVTQVRPFLLALLQCRKNKAIDQTLLINIIFNLENFHFIFSKICQDRASGLEGVYTRTAKRLYLAGNNKQKVREELKTLNDYLISKLPNKQRVIDGVKKLNFSNSYDGDKKTIQTIFSKIEKHLQSTSEIQIGDFSLEHVQDQSTNEPWLAGIGNLIPLDEKINNEIKQGSNFKKKKDAYKKSSLKIVQKFLDSNVLDTWDEYDAKEWAFDIGTFLFYATSLRNI